MSKLKLPPVQIQTDVSRIPTEVDPHDWPYRFYTSLVDCRCFYAAWYGPRFRCEIDLRLSSLAQRFATTVNRLAGSTDKWFGFDETSSHVLGQADVFCKLSFFIASSQPTDTPKNEMITELERIVRESWPPPTPWLEASGVRPGHETHEWPPFMESVLRDLDEIAHYIDSTGRQHDQSWCEHTTDVFTELMNDLHLYSAGKPSSKRASIMHGIREYVPPATHLLWSSFLKAPPESTRQASGPPWPQRDELARHFHNAFGQSPWWGA